jgi:PTS system mannose-specific IID component
MTQPEETVQVKRVSRGTLLRSWLTWLTFSHSTYNYERLQGLGFAHAMSPIIRSLYESKEDVVGALRRHLVFFNTEPQLGAIVPGVTIAMEEQRAGGQEITDEAINGIKTGLMGPLSGLGDSITQGMITPILLALGISLASQGNLMGPVLYFILESAAIISMSYLAWFGGYRWGSSVVQRALAAQQVSLSLAANLTAGGKTVNLQTEVLDQMMKGILPLVLTLGIWWLLRRRVSPLILIGMVFVGGIDGTLLGWLGWTPTTITWQSALALALTVVLWWTILSPKVSRLVALVGLAATWGFMLSWGRWDLSLFAGTLALLWTVVRAQREARAKG